MLYKIYSRKRIKLYKPLENKHTGNVIKTQRIKKIIIACIIATITASIIINQLNPVFNAVCTERAKALATEIINVESNMEFDNIKYDDLVDVVKDKERKYKHVKG